jgi:hypothetical protein
MEKLGQNKKEEKCSKPHSCPLGGGEEAENTFVNHMDLTTHWQF